MGRKNSDNIKRDRRREALTRGNFICGCCKKELPVSEFVPRNEVKEFNLSSCCKECRNLTNKFTKMKSQYGLSKEEYVRLYNSQEGRCEICRRFVEFTSKTSNRNNIGNIDHDHKTGKIRSILCNDCNRGLGFFKDDKNLLLKAYRYLVVHDKSGELLGTPEMDNQQPSSGSAESTEKVQRLIGEQHKQ